MIRATIIAAALGFGAGWLVNGWRQDALELVAQKAAISAAVKTQAKSEAIASAVEGRLAALKITERIIDRGVIREIKTNSTIYSRECLPAAGRLLINAAAKGHAASQPAGALPLRAAAAD
ncbi:hypothetical protein [Janthinobacterium sp. B9-8]|uniref:hypothetical protein n=1 Tax=Janthinobacterium sp. B9-8 TaxID=1236179 RepID=UPI00061CF0DA|nr:hypothetical protein [Janthinobacterium sp. B9-8]AMC35418.1 hypothetical protein VN23_12740 [Janthinobacterium sp. B9-8]